MDSKTVPYLLELAISMRDAIALPESLWSVRMWFANQVIPQSRGYYVSLSLTAFRTTGNGIRSLGRRS